MPSSEGDMSRDEHSIRHRQKQHIPEKILLSTYNRDAFFRVELVSGQ
jgi:hypothetical protein